MPVDESHTRTNVSSEPNTMRLPSLELTKVNFRSLVDSPSRSKSLTDVTSMTVGLKV
jgi:hypothetical protein